MDTKRPPVVVRKPEERKALLGGFMKRREDWMVSEHQRNTSRLFPVLLWLQASFPKYVKRSLNLFGQVVLFVAPRKKVLLQFVGSILKRELHKK